MATAAARIAISGLKDIMDTNTDQVPAALGHFTMHVDHNIKLASHLRQFKGNVNCILVAEAAHLGPAKIPAQGFAEEAGTGHQLKPM